MARGDALDIIESLIEENSFDTVFWNRRYAPQERDVDAVVKSTLKDKGLNVESFAGNLLAEPGRSKPAAAVLIRSLHLMPKRCVSRA